MNIFFFALTLRLRIKSARQSDGWVGPTVVLCIYGFCSMMRPVEPFMTEFLTGSYKNFTTEQVIPLKLILDCKDCYSSMAVLFFCIWSATGRCGFYQVSSYVQVLWVYKQPQHNFTAYNGGVDSVATLSGAAASIAVGHVSLEWCVWGELILGGFTLLIAGAVFLMALTNNIWLSYTCYMLFKTLYMQLITICTFQIARKLTRERYALVFGVNSFMGTVLQSVLTAVVINTKSLRLTITSQFFVYASYFAAIGLLFTVRGVYTALHRNQPSPGNQAERATHLPQGSRL
uniref:Solute carrier family 19 member 3 n=1 Tax=Myripristis murdjan TaxID=586833 RepID=A0A667ZUA1_9TELE